MKGLIMGLWIGGCFLLISACDSSDSGPVNDGGLTDVSQEPDGQEVEEGGGEEPVAECPPLPPVLENSRVTVQGTEFVDALGRVVLFRGINGGGRSKFPPFLPFDFAESETEIYEGALPFADAVEQYANRIESWGHNVVRLPFTWEALEPVRDAFDEAWLSRYEALVNALTARDIYVIVDFHQDVYSRAFCGDGFPFWTLSEPPPELTPMEECADWFLGYIIPGPSRDAFDRFWNNEDNLHVEFQDMWIHMIERFKDNERVLGFELMNEPGAGNANEATFVATTLSDFYNESIGVLREKATPATLFFDSTGLEGVSSSTSLVRPDGEGLAFAPHYYDPVALLSAGEFEAAESYNEPIGKWRAQGDAWNMPVLLGEFGARRELASAGEFIEKAFDALDAHLFHGTAWEYSESALDWNMEGLSIYTPWDGEFPTAKATIRAYPSAVAGDLLSFHFDAETRKGVLEYEPWLDGITEVTVPTRLYPEGVAIEMVEGEGCFTLLVDAEKVVIRAQDTQTIVVAFAPQ
jgi:endoglycosylceramidase